MRKLSSTFQIETVVHTKEKSTKNVWQDQSEMAFWIPVGHVENLEIITPIVTRRRRKKWGEEEEEEEDDDEENKKKEEEEQTSYERMPEFFPWRIEVMRKTGKYRELQITEHRPHSRGLVRSSEE